MPRIAHAARVDQQQLDLVFCVELVLDAFGAAPPKANRKQPADLRRFAELKGEKLDKAYAGKMVDGHKSTIALFETQAQRADAAELKQFAGTALPVLKEHLKALALADNGK